MAFSHFRIRRPHRAPTADPQHVYSVRFEGSELWGDHANANASVYIDLFDDYLDSA